ncbi:hypothetical protein [Streptomyces sp. NPDC046887]|uniref:hypothetical protein n=1 Tax=Streptomyces sp. NPDC046887 TaxID=3155472 RepID=UPI0033D5CADA
MSTLETSRELIRHSYYRYEFATAAVPHSLFALEQVLTERLGAGAPLRDLIEQATGAGLIEAELAARLDRGRLLRDKLTQGAATSAALTPARAVDLVGAVFDAVSLLLPPPPPPPKTAADTTSPSEASLADLWQTHRHAPFPAGFRGVDLEGVELVLLDADVAALVQQELSTGLDGTGIAVLWACVSDLDRVRPLINEEYCATYFARLRTLAALAAGRHIPTAT